ncbi:MAG: glycosyltransferase family 39 protein [Kiritimatiellae bacterium]|nr:glycosyltransferase family 39 protein [Kiritimatiellia bacterium]
MSKRAAIHEAGGLALILAAYVAFLCLYAVPAYTGTDPNGYHVTARLFQQHNRFHQVPADDYAFVGRMWVVNERGEYYAKYPPFYPALAGLAMKAFGLRAGFFVNPICAVLAVLGMYGLGRSLGLRRAAVLAAFVLATNPVFNFYAIRQVSHPSSVCFIVWGYALFLAGEKAATARRGLLLCAGAGLLVGYAAGIRYTNVLLALPLTVRAAACPRERLRGVLLPWLAGLAVPYAVLAGYHATAFGSPCLTGYSLTYEQTGFGWAYFRENFRFYAVGMAASGLGPLFVLACLGFVRSWRRDRRDALLFTLWIVPLSVLYTSYYWAPEVRHEGFLRFLLPVFVPAIVLAVEFLRDMKGAFQAESARGVAPAPEPAPNRRPLFGALAAAPGPGRLLILAFAVCQGLWGVFLSLEKVEPHWDRLAQHDRTVRSLRRILPAGATVFADDTLLNFLDFFQDYTLYPYEILHRNRARQTVARALRPGPAGLQKQRARLLHERLCAVDDKTYRSRIRALFETRLAAGPVYFVGPMNAVNFFRSAYLRHLEFELVDEMESRLPLYRLLPPVKLRTFQDRAAGARKPRGIQILRVTRLRDKPITPAEELEILEQERRDVTAELVGDEQENVDRLRRLQQLDRRIEKLKAVTKRGR